MGQSILNTVVQLLNDSGLPTEPAQPAATMTAIHMPVAAVSLERADRESKTVTVLVEIVAPMVSGALQCQHRALDVCQILAQEGAICSQGECLFDSRSGMFITPVKAVFSGIALSDDWITIAPNTVAINGEALSYCTRFTAEKKLDSIRPTLDDVSWTVSVEEFFPAGVTEPEELTEAFTVRVSSQGKQETYSSCTLTGIQRITTPEGIRQLRTATTTARTLED